MPHAPSAGRTRVIVVGPAPDMTGGMASVVAQTLHLDYRGRYEVELFPITLAPGTGESLAGRVGRHLVQVRGLRRRIRETAARIVHLHTCSGFSFYRAGLDLWTAGSMGCRTTLHIHGAAFDEFWARSSPPARNLIRRVLTGADRVIALSRGWRDQLRMMAPRAKVVVVENAVEAPPPTAPEPRKDGPRRFLLLARMDVWKGIDDLLEACARVRESGPDFEVMLAGPPGSAGDDAVLARKIAAGGLNGTVRYVGPVYGDEKWHLLRAADIYLQPSHNEGMPISILEALAIGLPVIATTVGAVPEVLRHGCHGLLVPPRQPDKLADAMRELLRRKALCTAMAHNATRLASSRFSLDRLRDDVVALYDELLKPVSVPPARSALRVSGSRPSRWGLSRSGGRSPV